MSTPIDLTRVLHASTCPACGYHAAAPFYDGGMQPLATIAWPASAQEAQRLPRLPLDFVRCVDCGHVFNQQFDYRNVPYAELPNRMFNRGTYWQDHLTLVRDQVLERTSTGATVVEIGCGDGRLLQTLAEQRPDLTLVGFDPNASTSGKTAGPTLHKVELRRQLFVPEEHLIDLRPDVVVMRHVLEHLEDPLTFLQRISFASDFHNTPTHMFLEVPCVDRALETGRTSDFFYEHNSHFTTASFKRMLERAPIEIDCVERAYDDEVIYAVGQVGMRRGRGCFAHHALNFHGRAKESQSTIRRQLDELHASGKRVAIWGGTGKAAAFINLAGADATRFPVVVDSDRSKAGSYVPSSAQEILFRDHLLSHPVDVIVIGTQWRAREIAVEIESCGIQYERLLIEHNGELVNYYSQSHPYRNCA